MSQLAMANLSPTPFTRVSFVTSFRTSKSVRQNPTDGASATSSPSHRCWIQDLLCIVYSTAQ